MEEEQLLILVIDDDEVDRMAIARALRKTGLNTLLHEADSIDSALEIIDTKPWDCIFLDYLLPGGDGLELLTQFREKGLDMPVVIVTSQGDEKIAVKAMKAGGSDYISKNLLNPQAVAKVLINAVRTYRAESDRKKTAKALANSEARLAEAQRIADIGSWEIDLDANEGYWTEQVFRILGYSKPRGLKVSFQRFLSHVHPDDLARAASDYSNCVSKGLPMKTDLRVLRKDEKIRQVEIQGKPVKSESGNTVKIVGTIQDITHRKSIEQALIEARNLAERNAKAKEEFLANMSHEIRTPMNAILGFGKLLSETTLNPQQKEYLQAIDYSGEALLAIINDILDLSKIEAGKLHFEHQVFSIIEMLKTLEAIFRPKAKENKLEFGWVLGPGVPQYLVGAPTRLNQVLLNLLGNAFKFTSEGEISIEVKLKAETETQLRLVFEVVDTGIGIPADKLESIFESFTQASNDTTRKFGGTGLGLTICKRIIELQGGRIGLQSEIGEGSVFFFELDFDLPDQAEIAKTLARKESTVPSGRSLDVILAEDNKMNQRLATIILQKLGHEVRVASSGYEVLREIDFQVPDIVLMDIQMPDMDGYEATKQIRLNEEKAIAELPIIALTAHALLEEVEKCKAAGMDAFISKPFQSDVLQAKMLELTSGKESAIPKAPTPELQAISKRQAAPIDLAKLDELTAGNNDFRQELIDIFLAEVPKNMIKLEVALAANDFHAIYQIAHGVKPSLILFGIPNAAENVSLIETKAKSETRDEVLEKAVQIVVKDAEAAEKSLLALG